MAAVVTLAPQQERSWDRVIILVDMNAFFASVEQRDHPEWRARPVVITNGAIGTCIITCSYEARAYGVKTGMRLKEAREKCPHLIHAPSRPHRYAETSTRIMEALATITPDMEIFSVDEAFLDVTRVQSLLGSPLAIARLVKQRVVQASGLLCSVGVSGDKTTAKYAAKLNKPDGMTIIPPWESRIRLQDVPVTELCGINKGIGGFLAQHGVHRCGDMERLPISVLGQRYGNPGKRIWYMAQGLNPDGLKTTVAPPKSIGHGKVMPPNTRDRTTLLIYLRHMCHKVAARLRKHGLKSTHFYLAIRTSEGWLKTVAQSDAPCDDETLIYRMTQQFLAHAWQGEGVFQVQITAQKPSSTVQGDLFSRSDPQRMAQNHVMDQINQRYGQLTLASARLIGRSSMPDVIAPSWQPTGHRQTI